MKESNNKTESNLMECHGEYNEINKHLLVIPTDEYQRNQNLGAVHKGQNHGTKSSPKQIAQNFRWESFGCLSVSRRTDGKYAVVDGGNRLRAALLREDIQCVPCLVFPMEIKDEIITFEHINENRSAINTYDRVKKDIFAGKPLHVHIKNRLSMHGLRFAESSNDSGSNVFRPVYTLLQIYERTKDINSADRILDAAIEICGKGVKGEILKGLRYISRANPGIDIRCRNVQGKLKEIGADSILQLIKRECIALSSGCNERVCGIAMIKYLNKGVRGNKLNIIE